MWMLLSIGIALGELLAVQQFGWQCLMLMHLRCRGVIASVLDGYGVSLGLRGFR